MKQHTDQELQTRQC